MSIPVPKDGDQRSHGPFGQTARERKAQHDAEYGKKKDESWWPVPGKPGYYTNSGGRLKYDPQTDPSHPAYQQRI